jgi:hypothetical protein
LTDSLEERQREQAECDRKEKRAREILDRLAHLQEGSSVFGRKSSSGRLVSAWDWKIAVEWALKRIGPVCVFILDQRLRYDRSFVALAGRLEIDRNDAVYMFQVGLVSFLEQMDRLNRDGIPDDYTERIAA